MKFKTYVFIASLVLLEVAAGNKEDHLVEGIKPGDKIPEISFLDKDKVSNNNIKFTNSEGRYTFINFWATYDAESRVNNIYFCKEAKKLGENKLNLYSISLDKNESVFDATVKTDNLNHSKQLWNKLVAFPEELKELSLNRQIKNLLVDDNGVIVKQNLSPSELRFFLR